AAAARAQAMFDCWMQEQEEAHQPAEIAACRAEFEKAYALLGIPKSKMAKVAVKAKKLPFPFHVYFASDSTELDGTAMMVINQVFSDFRLHKPSSIEVSGHADTVGNTKYNAGLARHRAVTVRNELIKLGITSKQVVRKSYGEEKPAVKTGDNMDEEYNRVVKITFNR
ncbi:MAG: OmpA family protein, partial [Rhodospirillales bacterium]